MYKSLIFLILIIFAAGKSHSQDQTISLYAGKAPGSESWTQKEAKMYSDLFKTEVVYNVTNPSLLVFRGNKTDANGTAIIIAPGGGFQSLSINREGIDLAKKLADKGVTAFVFKYRLVETKSNDPAKEMMENLKDREKFIEKTATVREMAGEDIRTAIAYIKENAEGFGIDPDRLGVIGFSAGASIIMESVLGSENKLHVPTFAAAIYGGVGNELLEAQIPKNETPLFICAASDDQLGLAPNSIGLYTKWLKSGYPVELHMYATGGHGFGMGTQNLPVDTWDDRFLEWLRQFGFLN